MKKIFCAVLCILMLWLSLAGCGDEDYDNKTAMIYLNGNLIAEGKIEKCRGWSYGSWSVTIDGVTYETHSSNVVIITDISKGERHGQPCDHNDSE